MKPSHALLAAAAASLAACTSARDDRGAPPRRPEPAELLASPAAQQIDADELLRHIAVLSSDEFEGRGPGTRGEELTVAYLTDQFRRLGLAPGNPDGTYVQ